MNSHEDAVCILITVCKKLVGSSRHAIKVETGALLLGSVFSSGRLGGGGGGGGGGPLQCPLATAGPLWNPVGEGPWPSSHGISVVSPSWPRADRDTRLECDPTQ